MSCLDSTSEESRFDGFEGMNVAAGPELAAAVTNAGGLGVIGGHGYTPKVLKLQVRITQRSQSAPSPSKSASDSSYQEGLEGSECSIWS